jgi:hypothetical protein
MPDMSIEKMVYNYREPIVASLTLYKIIPASVSNKNV